MCSLNYVVCLHCWFTCILLTMPCLLTCVLWMTSYLCNCGLWMMSCLCACTLQMVSHWFPCDLWMMSCCFTCVWVMTGWDVQEGRIGGTWLPGEFLAPLSWRHHSSAQTGRRMPGHSEDVTSQIDCNEYVHPSTKEHFQIVLNSTACHRLLTNTVCILLFTNNN